MSVHDLQGRPTHERSLELAATAIDGGMTRAETTELEAHLAGCQTCARRAAAMRADAAALGRPLDLLPSARVDAAVAAKIAGRPAGPQRLVLIAAAALLLLALLGAAAVGAYLLRTQDRLPTTVVPPPNVPVAIASPDPTASPAGSPSAEPSATEPGGGAIDPVVVLRVNIVSDTGTGRYPSLTVYRDGTIVSRGGAMTRLTPAGLGLLMAPAFESDLLVTSGQINPDPSYVGGVPLWSIDVRRGEAFVRRATTHSGAVPSTQRIEADRIVALAERLVDRELWLPTDAWAVGPTSAARYTPARFLLVMAIEDGPGRPDLALDVADLDWPLPGRFGDFGRVAAEPPPGVAGETWRCDPVTPAEALAVQRALAAAPVRSEGENLDADLDWAASRKHVTVSLVPLLPEDPPSCAVVGLAPETPTETAGQTPPASP